MNFGYSKMKNINFKECNIEGAIFLECSFNKVGYKECNLSNSEFTNTPLKQVDFRDSDIYEISLTGRELKDAIDSPLQAVELSRLLGLIVK